MKTKQKVDIKVTTSNTVGVYEMVRYDNQWFLLRGFLIAVLAVLTVVFAGLLTTMPVHAATPKCFETTENFQNTYNVDTGEITRSPATTQSISCSELRKHTSITLKNNKCYRLYTLSSTHFDTGASEFYQWVKAMDCTLAQTCADDFGGIPVRADLNAYYVETADVKVAASFDECAAPLSEITNNCPECAAPDDIPDDTTDYANGNPEATAFCKDEKGYAEPDLSACILGYKGSTCELVVDNPTPAQQKAYDSCVAGRIGGGHGPPPGNTECKTNIINVGCDKDSVFQLLGLVLSIMTAGVGIVAVGGISYGAFLYTTAGGSQDQVKRAMGVIQNVVIGLVAYVCLYAFLDFLLPGGVF